MLLAYLVDVFITLISGDFEIPYDYLCFKIIVFFLKITFYKIYHVSSKSKNPETNVILIT